MISTGVTGQPWRASISEWGAISPWDSTPDLNWFVAADDRWHVPEVEPTVRQRRVDGTPVTETRVRVPQGDVVQTVYSCADFGGITVVEVLNESTLPVAIAFDRRDVLTERPIAEVPIEGIDLPAGAFVLPLGHRARLRVGVAHESPGNGVLPAGLPSAMQVVRGWSALTERASRLALPDGDLGASLAERVKAARCELALGAIDSARDDAASFCVGLHELVRMGERPDPWLPELVEAVERLGPLAGWAPDVALAAAARTLAIAGERRALSDVGRIVDRRVVADPPVTPPDDALCIPWLESRLATGGALLPFGFPADWLGQSIEFYGVPTGPSSTLSLAVRWHGERPAVLWEQSGASIALSSPVVAPGWTASAATGEALWPRP